MLNPVTLLTNDGLLSNAWKGLVRRLQTTVEATRLTNAFGADRFRAQLVYCNGDGTFQLASDATAPEAQAIGALLQDVLSGSSGLLRTDNVAWVQFIDGIVGLTAGDPVYVSATPGSAVNAPGGLTQIYRIGTVFDASPYVSVTNPYAWVLLDRCCTPVQNP